MEKKIKQNNSLIVLFFFLGVLATLITYRLIPQKVVTNNINNDNTRVTVVESNSLKESINKIYNAVVLVETYKGDDVSSTGTGFVYKIDSQYGYIITNNHVVSSGDKYNIKYIDETATEGTLLGRDEYTDVAVIRVPISSVKQVAIMGDSDESNIGDTVFTVGSPMGSTYMGTVTRGILSGMNRVVEVTLSSGNYYMQVMQTDAAINPGNSGGPLVNMKGEVIGINSMKLVEDEIEGMGFAIPIEIAMAAIDKLEKGEKVLRPVLGVELIDANNTYALYYNRISIDEEINEGTVVAGVEEGYPAIDAGIKKGDVILEINGEKIEDSAHFRFLLYKYDVNETVTLKIYRNKKIKDIKVTLSKAVE